MNLELTPLYCADCGRIAVNDNVQLCVKCLKKIGFVKMECEKE